MNTISKSLSLSLAVFALSCFALSPGAQAVSPAPDGGYPGQNTAEGDDALFRLSTGTDNTANGAFVLASNTSGSYNTADGVFALGFNTTGYKNAANGFQALFYNSTGSQNTAQGFQALYNNTIGNTNIALGFNAGAELTTGDYNIDIGNIGIAGESSTIRIGTSTAQSKSFIAGIRGVTTINPNAIPVLIDSAGQLGTASSSARFKRDIKSMDKISEAILKLKPVTFHYKSDNTGTPQFGLIAEDVAEVSPDLVVRDPDGQIYTVRYEAVNAMLLNEFLKEHRKVKELEATLAEQAKSFQATTAQQQREIQVLTASVKEQAAQIEKVSAQIEVRQSAPQVVSNAP